MVKNKSNYDDRYLSYMQLNDTQKFADLSFCLTQFKFIKSKKYIS